METCCGLGTACARVKPVHTPLTLHPTTPDQAQCTPVPALPARAHFRRLKRFQWPRPVEQKRNLSLAVGLEERVCSCRHSNAVYHHTHPRRSRNLQRVPFQRRGLFTPIYPHQHTSPPSGPTHPWPTPVPTEPSSTSVFNSHPQLNTRYSHQDLHQGPLQPRSRPALPANPRAHLLVWV